MEVGLGHGVNYEIYLKKMFLNVEKSVFDWYSR